MTIEALRHEMQIQFPYWSWDGQSRDGDASTYLLAAREQAEAGNIGIMESMIAMALITSGATFLNETEIMTIRIHGYGVSVHSTLNVLFELEDTYDARRNDAANLAVINLIAAKAQLKATVTAEERAETMVSASGKFDSNHLAILEFEYPRVEKAQQKLDELLSNPTLAV